MARRRYIDEQHDPVVRMPSRLFLSPLFRCNYERLGKWFHMWSFAMEKANPRLRPFFDLDDKEIATAVHLGFLERGENGDLYLTGPEREHDWLVAKPQTRPSIQTYVVEAEGQNIVKIGRTGDVPKRLSALQTGCPFNLRLVVAIDGDIEFELHQRFASLRLAGEWFRFDQPIRDALVAMGAV